MDPLSDPLNNRSVKSVKPPPHKHLDESLIWPNNSLKPDWKIIRDHLSKEGRLTKPNFLKIVSDGTKIFKNEGNLLSLHDPVTVVGDIHGQFYDLIKILEVGGSPTNTKYLFLGDFVDRGCFSIEVIALLYSIKINYPSTIYFIRGNHEARQMTSFFNFRDECLYKYDQEVYEILMDAFDALPLACILNSKFLSVHGGISPELKTLDDIRQINRFKEPPRQGIFCDLIWSDPVDNDNGISEHAYKQNDVRGCSYYYGGEAVRKFLDSNNLISVIRAHEAQLDGYKMHRWNGQNSFPAVITIFSAPNYCDVYQNKGAVIKFENNTLNIQQYNYSQHPYLLPNFMDIFTWSIPFVAEKVTEMLYHVLKLNDEITNDEELDENDLKRIENLTKKQNQNFTSASSQTSIQSQSNSNGQSTPTDKPKSKAEILRNKIKFISKMMKMQSTLRKESENIMLLKGQCPDNRLPKEILLQGSGAIMNAVDRFKFAKSADIINEKMPEIGPHLRNKQPLKPIKQ